MAQEVNEEHTIRFEPIFLPDWQAYSYDNASVSNGEYTPSN